MLEFFAGVYVGVAVSVIVVGAILAFRDIRTPLPGSRIDSFDVSPPPVATSRPVAELLDDFPDDTPPPPRGGSGQACACCRCCHPPTTGQWIPPAWAKTVDIMSRKGEQ